MKQKIKVIQIGSASSSYSTENYKEDIFRAWYTQVAFQIKKFYPGIEVECWTIERKERKERVKECGGIKFRVFPTNFSFRHGMEISLPMLKALIKEQKEAIKKNQKLIIHLHEYHTWQSYLSLVVSKKIKNIKIIAQHHGARNPFANLKKYKKLFLLLPLFSLMQFFENLLLKKVNIFYALSDLEIKYLRKIAPNSEIKFQTMGIEDVYFKIGSKKNKRIKLGFDLNKKYVIFIGRLIRQKGIKELLDAAKELKEINFLVIGRREEFEKYVGYTKKRAIKNVIFLGPMYGVEKLNYLSASDCLILPSYTEGAPVVLMEAIAKNVPVIATDVGGIKKMIKNNREGIIIKPKSKKDIIRAVKEILQWKNKPISKYAEKYRWEKIVDQTYRDYIKC